MICGLGDLDDPPLRSRLVRALLRRDNEATVISVSRLLTFRATQLGGAEATPTSDTIFQFFTELVVQLKEQRSTVLLADLKRLLFVESAQIKNLLCKEESLSFGKITSQ